MALEARRKLTREKSRKSCVRVPLNYQTNRFACRLLLMTHNVSKITCIYVIKKRYTIINIIDILIVSANTIGQF